MSYASSSRSKQARAEREARQRERARLERRRAIARRRSRRALIALGIVAVLGGGTALTVTQVQAAHARAALDGPNNMLSDGVFLSGDGSTVTALVTSANDADTPPVATAVDRTAGVPDAVWHVDYTDPDAATFWATNGKTIRDLVTNGQLTLELHPIGHDDAALAAGGVLACVADTDQAAALDVHDALLTAADQLAAATPDDLVAIATGAGATSTTVTDCISHGRYTGWVDAATDRAADAVPYAALGPVTGTSFAAADQPYEGAPDDAAAFTAFLDQVRASLPTS